jgi:4-hydroxy-tetrahydrodipicolinate synthase
MSFDRDTLHGIITAVPTPFDSGERVDVTSLRRIIGHQIENGVHGLWVLGAGSEFSALDGSQTRVAVTTAVDEARGRVPVIVGTGAAGTTLSMRQARLAAECGADAIFVTPPYYYHYREEEVFGHVLAVAESSSLPVVLYNNPSNTKFNFPRRLVERLCRHEKVVGIKDSSLDFDRFQEILRCVPRDGSFKVLQGDEYSLAASFLFGADGAVIALPNIAPKLCVELYEQGRAGNTRAALDLQAAVTELCSIFTVPGTGGDGGFLGGQKAALELMGLCSRRLSLPFATFDEAQVDRVREILARFELPGAQPA